MILKKLCRASKRSIMGIMALAAVSSMVISGCGSNKGTVSETSTQAQPQSAAAENNEGSAQEQKVMKLAATLMPDTSPIKCLTDMSVKLKDETQGAVDIQIFPASQLGGQRDFVEGVSMGTVEMCIVGVGALESFEPRFSIYGMPFLFEDNDHLYKFYDSDINQKILQDFCDQKGMRVIGLFNEGFRTVWTKEKPVESLADFKGLKLRVPEVPIFVDMFTTLGCNATPLPAGDVYTALQTGMIEGVELPVSSIVGGKINEVVKYETVTNHVSGAMVVLINEGYYQSLTGEQQQMLLAAVKEASDADRANMVTDTEKYEKVIAESGIQQIIPSEEMMAQFREAMNGVSEKYFKDVIDQETIGQIRAMAE